MNIKKHTWNVIGLIFIKLDKTQMFIFRFCSLEEPRDMKCNKQQVCLKNTRMEYWLITNKSGYIQEGVWQLKNMNWRYEHKMSFTQSK